MANIKIEKNSSLSPQEAFDKIKNFLSDDPDLRKMDKSYQCNFDDSSLTGNAKGSKFEASLNVASAGEGSNVLLEVKLPLMLRPFQSMVESTLTKKMDKVLA